MNAMQHDHLLPEWSQPVSASGMATGAEAVRSMHYVWESWFGVMVIDVVDGEIYVDGKHVALDRER